MKFLLEEEHAVLKDRLRRNLKRKHALELEINRQYKKLKKLEISMEKRASVPISEEGQLRPSCFVCEASNLLRVGVQNKKKVEKANGLCSRSCSVSFSASTCLLPQLLESERALPSMGTETLERWISGLELL